MKDSFVVIGSWENVDSRTLTLQDFVADGVAFIPLFTDEETFKHEARGSGFESAGILIDKDFLHSLLRGDELLILNPGSTNPLRLTKADLAGDAASVGA